MINEIFKKIAIDYKRNKRLSYAKFTKKRCEFSKIIKRENIVEFQIKTPANVIKQGLNNQVLVN